SFFAVFNSRSWLTHLMYQLVFGDGVASVMMLAVLLEIYYASKREHLSVFHFAGLNLLVGLLGVSKAPVTYIFPLLLIPLYGLCFKKVLWPPKLKSLITLGALALCALPNTLWRLFTWGNEIKQIQLSGFDLKTYVSHLLHPYTELLYKCFLNIAVDADMLAYYALLSAAMVIIFRPKGIRLLFVPLLLHFLLLVNYYAYIYYQGDWGSFMRYFLPIVPALFYVAGLTFEHWIKWIGQKAWAGWQKITLAVISLAIVFVKLF
ncbi:MAG: hypothetical protein Q7S13_06305, partial [Candidatus Omnitrophota bacterium]|nr:hypothetical protein [Candidatus Omnitrophota bacterium]